MENDFWHDRWEKDQIGFHQPDINPYLRTYWPSLDLAPDNVVFVPMCGKSRDMLWLREQGYEVLGVELSPKAVSDFFREYKVEVSKFSSGKFSCCSHDGITLLCGDFFDLIGAHTCNVTAVYDRAALIALPPNMRKRYVDHLVRLLPSGAKILLITTEYPQAEMQGPPFSVCSNEIQTLYSRYGEIVTLESVDVLSANPGFRERGLSALTECIYLITLNQ